MRLMRSKPSIAATGRCRALCQAIQWVVWFQVALTPVSGYLEKKSCYSCMSSAYAPFWETLQGTYFKPMNFTNTCGEKFSSDNMGTIQCTGPCITMMEGLSIAGQDLDPAYIRGCFNKILVAGFNDSAVTTHRIRYMERCIVADRQQLFNGKTNQGHVRICGCLSDRCNGPENIVLGNSGKRQQHWDAMLK